MKRRAVYLLTLAALAVGLVPFAGQGVGNLAELSVTQIVLDPPSTIQRGVTVEITACVMNTGSRSADGFSVSLFYRPQTDAGSWVLHDTVEDLTLAPSQQPCYTVTFTLDTMDLDLGTYDLRIVADSGTQISETDELNNELLTTLSLVESSLGLPDLQPTTLTYAPTNPSSSDDMDPWNVKTTIENGGQVQAGQFTVSFYVDDELFSQQVRFVLPAGGATEVTAELDPQELGLQAGTHEIVIFVDPDDANFEQDEANNTIAGSLTLQQMELAPLSLSFDRSIVYLDEEVEVSAHVTNTGEGVAKNVEVAFYAGHVKFATESISILGRGMTATVTATLTPQKKGLTEAGVYEFRVVVDPNDLLTETDEANNTLSRTLTIQPPQVSQPELHPESIELSPASPVEQHAGIVNVTVSSAIRNTGREAADGFSVSFDYRIKGGVRWTAFPCTDGASCQDVTLDAGAQTRLVGSFGVGTAQLSPGIYEVRVRVDTDDAIDELDETNNELVTTLTVVASRQPDLAFVGNTTPITTPYAPEAGQTVLVTAQIVNIGDVAAGPFAVQFSKYIEGIDPAAAASFAPLGEVAVNGLAVGESREVSMYLDTGRLTQFQPGTHVIRIAIDSSNEVTERNETTNNTVDFVLLVTGPDLRVEATLPGVSVEETDAGLILPVVAPGQIIDVSATVFNDGLTPAGLFDVTFQLVPAGVEPDALSCDDEDGLSCEPGMAIKTISVPGIAGQGSIPMACTLDTAGIEPGQYYVYVYADANNTVIEHNEQNNDWEIPVLITGDPVNGGGTPVDGCCADLRPVSLYALALHSSPGTTRAWATIANDGAVASGPFYVWFDVLNERTGEVLLTQSKAIEPLEPGETACPLVEFDTSGLAPGRYVVRVEADCNNLVIETNELNNALQSVFNVN